MPLRVRFRRLTKKAVAPYAMTSGAAGVDLCTVELVVLAPGDRALVRTGLAVAIPVGYEGQVRPRSGHAWKKGLTVLNSPGTIDSDYRGEVKVILFNGGREVVTVDEGERIAQLVIVPVPSVEWVEVLCGELEQTERGSGGFGSTGA